MLNPDCLEVWTLKSSFEAASSAWEVASMQGEQQGGGISVHDAGHLHNTLLGEVKVEGFCDRPAARVAILPQRTRKQS